MAVHICITFVTHQRIMLGENTESHEVVYIHQPAALFYQFLALNILSSDLAAAVHVLAHATTKAAHDFEKNFKGHSRFFSESTHNKLRGK
eukprot:m.61108 g.61108  ORF g.61108 m.61108 type:complete len:90 (-) comp11847_c0_seq1:147-416(-)